MLTDQQATENDRLDRERVYNVLAGLAGAALGVDPGYAPYDQTRLSSLPSGQPNQFFSVAATATGPGEAAAVTATVAGRQITVPVLLLVAVGAWLIFRRS